ncbi:hypothetical protein AB0H94_34890 [Streptomyces purpurascens]|uniref:hypothetical protein n=1 Tax=Streptomyces purpurascens TaxID=1924 RepID=UPI0033C89DFB
MDVVVMVGFAVAVLTPGIKALLCSLAYRIRARGTAEIIRAEGEARQAMAGSAQGKRGKKRG